MQNTTLTMPRNGTARTLEEVAALAFLVRYQGDTRYKYTNDLRFFFEWCRSNDLNPLEVHRVHLELYSTHLSESRGNSPATVHGKLSTLCGFYRIATGDEFVAKNPAVNLRLPKVIWDSEKAMTMSRIEMGKLLGIATASNPADGALIGMMCLMGLRVSEACGILIENCRTEIRGHRVMRFTGKGGKPATLPLTIHMQRLIDAAAGDRTSGPVVLTKSGGPQNRRGAYGRMKILVKRAGLPAGLHPHSARHAAISGAIKAGATLRDAQIMARHSDPRQTAKYDHSQVDFDRSAVHMLGAFVPVGHY